MLEREVDVAADMAGGGHDGEKFVADERRVAVEEAEPVVAANPVEAGEQRGERSAVAQVAAVGGDILRDDIEFADAGAD